MMGFTLQQTNIPIVKTSNCILAASHKELPQPDPAMACIRCGMCSEVCPAELLPQQLYWFAKGEEFEKAEHHNLFDCIECGACSYVCPSSIPLVQYYRYAKGEVKQIKADQEKSNQARERFEFRQERIEREKEDKEAKRKARSEAAAKAQAAKKAAAEAAAKEDKDQASIKTDIKVSPAPEVTLESLQKKLLMAEDKLSKMETAWKDAQENNPERAEKLAVAVESSKANVEKFKQQITALNGPVSDTPSAPAGPSLEELKSNLEKTKGKLQLILNTLEDAKQNHPDRVEKLERAVAKNHTRVASAEAALSEASELLSNQASTNQASTKDES